MRSPAAAVAWEFHYRQRWYLIALTVYLLVLGLSKPLLFPTTHVVDLGDGYAAFAVVPFSVTFMYFIAVFTFGMTGDLAARQSIYPARMFTLPISTAALAGWPMLYGTVTMAALWVAVRILARWPWQMELPVVWPGFLGAAVLAWMQALTWMPYGLRGVRGITAVIVLISLDVVVMLAIEYRWSEAALVAFLAPNLPLAYACAWAAVARARRGDVPDWSLSTARAGGARRLRPFRSTSAAQFWFEWRRHGRTLPLLVGIVAPFELSVLFISGYGSQWFVFEVLTALLLTPILMAAFAAATVSQANPFARDIYGVSPFNATKPITSVAMISAKLKMAAWSTLASWFILLSVTAIGFVWSGADSVVIGWADRFRNQVGIARAIVALMIVLGGLISLTWTMLVQGLYIGLSGRQWLVRTIGMATLVFVMAIGPILESIADSRAALAWLWDNWKIVPAILVVVKVAAAIVVATRLSRSGLLGDRTLAAGAATWAAAVFAIYGVFVWWADTPMLPRYAFLLIAILAVPLVRISAAPLALDWNRHR
jgi:hypothetical protein